MDRGEGGRQRGGTWRRKGSGELERGEHFLSSGRQQTRRRNVSGDEIVSRGNRCGPDDHVGINGDWKGAKENDRPRMTFARPMFAFLGWQTEDWRRHE